MCGQSNRAAPFARDLFGGFNRQFITERSFFRDVRMTSSHFDELVAFSTPHFPRSSSRPTTIPPAYRHFSILFWLAQGRKQRVFARTVDVTNSTFSKHCAPVINALLTGFSKPKWPGCAKWQELNWDFARLMGGNAVCWRGLYACTIFLFPRRLLLCDYDLASSERNEKICVAPLVGRTTR